MNDSTQALEWIRVADVDELPPGRVKTVTAGTHSMALTNIDGEFTAMDNRCPHQGGPLGEGSIETGSDGTCMLRCPWHGHDFDLKTGKEIWANVEFYKGAVFHSLGIPSHYFTAMFAMARIYGYIAHYLEFSNDSRLIRPRARYLASAG